MSKEAMKQALRALEEYAQYTRGVMIPQTQCRGDDAILALRQAISELEQRSIEEAEKQEPVPWSQALEDVWARALHLEDAWAEPDEVPPPAQQEPVEKDNSNYRLDPPGLDPLYTSPPAQRPWVGLTDDERLEVAEIDGADEWFWKVCKAIEAKLKELNT